jgi:hypothetical protein
MPEHIPPKSHDNESPGLPPAGAEPETQSKRSLVDYITDPSARRIEWLAVMLIAVFGFALVVATRGDLVAQAIPVASGPDASEELVEAAPARDLPAAPYRLTDLTLHPDRSYESYFSGAFFTDGQRAAGQETSVMRAVDDFRAQLDIYRRRAGEDDNFSIRVYDNRTWQTLEVFSLREEREKFEQSGSANWGRIDALRRDASNGLISKWVSRGIPRDAIATRWGRLNQMIEAREREAAFIEYEIRYARQLGLSLLTTEIGTVETFNQDWLVSPAGARGRYQMMPDILDLFELRNYALSASSGTVTVREELHPLLSLLGSFQLVRGYSNSVGHEIPGVSAYHTGPGNIFTVYQTFLRAKANNPAVQDASVIEAYMWGVTSGFEQVWRQSSFGPASRGYVLSAYGALRAVDHKPIDPSRTLFTERVQLKPGAEITLRTFLDLLEPHGGRLNWGAGVDSGNPYERFRQLNPHIALPASQNDREMVVPDAGNIRLVAAVSGKPVRFFAPYGTTDLLSRLRPDLLDEALTFQFDDDAFADPALTGEKTQYDYAYDELVRDISQFGFTTQNQNRLEGLYRRFVTMAQENPTQYRQAQQKIIMIHRRVWHTRAFRDLAGTVQNVIQAKRAPIQAMTPAPPTASR